jgi:hypothetical protein
MQNTQLYRMRWPALAHDIACGPLPVFDQTELESVRRVFQSATPIPFQQAWLDETEAGFSPAVVRLGWHESSLLVFAELTDADIFNAATEINQPTWELGDVFEMFLQSVGKESYVELHVTPHNQRLQLRYPGGAAAEFAREMSRLEEFLVPDKIFNSVTWIENGKWHVFAEIPAVTVCGSNKSIENMQWRFSFGRYDCTRGVKEPVISSTSPHAIPDFHRQHEWGVMTFKNPPAI